MNYNGVEKSVMENTARKPPAEAEPEAPALIKPKAELEIDLKYPAQAFGTPLKKLIFRRPTGGDLMTLGDNYPVHITWQTGEVRPNPLPMGEIMSTLAQVPLSTIKALDAEDFATCAHALMGFFLPGAQAMQ
jgi:Phage tail assembly chaperone proteins, E, or 41 or 14